MIARSQVGCSRKAATFLPGHITVGLCSRLSSLAKVQMQQAKVAPSWRPRLFLRGARSVRPPVPWKHPHALTRQRAPSSISTPAISPESPRLGRSTIVDHLLLSKASFLDGYRAARSKAGLPPPPRASLRDRILRLRLETLPRYRQRAHSRLYRFFIERAARRSARTKERQITARLLTLAMDTSQERGSRRRRFAAMANNVYRAGVAAASEIRDQYNTSRAGEGSSGNSNGSDWEGDRPPNIPGAFPDVSFATGGDAQMVLFPMYAKRHVRKYQQRPQQASPYGAYGAYHERSSSSSSSSDDEGRMQVGRHPDAAPNWHQEFARLEDEKAIVDVYVHGWLYLANPGPLTRKNRILIGLARRLSGIPAPGQWVPVATGPDAAVATVSPTNNPGQRHEDLREAQKIIREAEAIELRGQGEKEVANRGGYSETPETAASYDDSSSDEGAGSHGRGAHSGYNTPRAFESPVSSHGPGAYPPPPGPGKLTPKSSWASVRSGGVGGGAAGGNGGGALEMTEAELNAANTNLLARLGPFLTTPVIDQPVTLFFYNDSKSQSRTVTTSDAGHFSTCAALDFVPTHVRVLVSSSNGVSSSSNVSRGVPANVSETALVNSLTDPLSAVAPIELVEDRGVSLISDIDDTIKSSNISMGTREIFRNTFVRELGDMTVEGAREWYNSLHDLGVQFHYCSNSPWQLFPMLTTFFKHAGLPKGPLHLKQYSGMLQGIFEPVAERKRGTLEKILRDFPRRRFLLVGDSGEADLEVYTDLVLAHPGRVLAIFIRDVTTPEQPGYFDASASTRTVPVSKAATIATERRPALPPRMASAPPKPEPQGPVMGTLIDFDDGPEITGSSTAVPPGAGFGAGGGLPSTIPPVSTSTASSSSSVNIAPGSRKPPPPPRPSKPLALRGSMATAASSSSVTGSSPTQSPSTTGTPSSRLVPPPPPPRKPVGSTSSASNSGRSSPRNATADYTDDVPPPPPPRRTQTADLRQERPDRSERSDTTERPDRSERPAQQQQSLPPNKKVDMWRRRLAHAQDVLGPQGVALYTWRRGQDVAVEAVGIVERALRESR
ncbi:hypothetical protein SBRCBS47491_007685 [Sporothrix bragantina]|uniref:Phosphatidate phosphatase APP1 catalytic domain-containing protein n=1 Tax=Sporothrix bragantina TaxID=671064 RepID=A0ABP0CFP3_9PEZI